jgi:uncharacterized protein YbcI
MTFDDWVPVIFRPVQMTDPGANGSTRSTDGAGAIVASISREIVSFYVEYHGRGPTRARTVWREGLVVCVLEDVFGKAEQILVDAGRFEQVRHHRQAVHETLEPLLRDTVEAATGHEIQACLGQVAPDGSAVEVFVLGSRIL